MAQEKEIQSQEQLPAQPAVDDVPKNIETPAVTLVPWAPQTPATAPQAIVLSIMGTDVLKRPIDEELLQTLAQLRHTHGLLTDESVNSYLVWLINSDMAQLLKDVANRRRG